MDVLVIDRDSLTTQLLGSRLEALGHRVTVEPNKNAAFDLLKALKYDCVMLDPAPIPEARPVVVALWKNLEGQQVPYILLLSKSATTDDAILSGTNDVLAKPFSAQDIETKLGNAERMMRVTRHLAHEDHVHSASGMVGKAAFYQLFLSSIDRAFRYGERNYIVFITITNFDDVHAALGDAGFEAALKKFTGQMTFMRRQSDVIGRLGPHEFAILLQRPQAENEPLNAIDRFAETLEKYHDGFGEGVIAPQMRLELIELPQGAFHAERFVPAVASAHIATEKA